MEGKQISPQSSCAAQLETVPCLLSRLEVTWKEYSGVDFEDSFILVALVWGGRCSEINPPKHRK